MIHKKKYAVQNKFQRSYVLCLCLLLISKNNRIFYILAMSNRSKMKYRTPRKVLQSFQIQQIRIQYERVLQKMNKAIIATIYPFKNQMEKINNLCKITKEKSQQLTSHLLERQVQLQKITDYRYVLGKYDQVINELRCKVIQKEYSIYEQVQWQQHIYPYKFFTISFDKINHFPFDEAYRRNIEKLWKELSILRREVKRLESSTNYELKKKRKILENEGEMNHHDDFKERNKRIIFKLMMKIIIEQEKEIELKEQFKYYKEIYKIVCMENRKFINEYQHQHRANEGNQNILDQIDQDTQDLEQTSRFTTKRKEERKQSSQN